MANVSWQIGMKLVHRAQPGWGVGAVVALGEDGLYLRVLFVGRTEGPVVLSTRDAALARHRFAPGAHVQLGVARAPGEVLAERGARQGFYAYDVEAADGRKLLDERDHFGPLAGPNTNHFGRPERDQLANHHFC